MKMHMRVKLAIILKIYKNYKRNYIYAACVAYRLSIILRWINTKKFAILFFYAACRRLIFWLGCTRNYV